MVTQHSMKGVNSSALKSRFDSLHSNFDKRAENVQKHTNDLKVFAMRLASGYQLSVQMVLNLNSVIGQYSEFITKLGETMSKLDNNFISGDDIQKINSLTQETVGASMQRFSEQVDKLAVIYQENDLTSSAAKLKESSQNIKTAVSNLTAPRRLGGGFVDKSGKLVVAKFARGIKSIFKSKRVKILVK